MRTISVVDAVKTCVIRVYMLFRKHLAFDLKVLPRPHFGIKAASHGEVSFEWGGEIRDSRDFAGSGSVLGNAA